MFLRLTDKDGDHRLFNMDNVTLISPSIIDRMTTPTMIVFVDDSHLKVQESLIDIEHMIDEKLGGE